MARKSDAELILLLKESLEACLDAMTQCRDNECREPRFWNEGGDGHYAMKVGEQAMNWLFEERGIVE